MKLTGKAKEKFENYTDSIEEFGYHFDKYEHFLELPQAMQWGVYQDWADSLGYDMITEANTEQTLYWFTIYGQEFISDVMFETRQEARNAAIEKLNYLINER